MDGFDDAFGESPAYNNDDFNNKSNGNGAGLLEDESDPAAEFLAREQSNFAGLEDEIPEVGGGGVPVAGVTTNGDVKTNGNGSALLDDDFVGNVGNDDEDNFLSQARPSSPPDFSSTPVIPTQREEPEKIRIWREEQKRRLEVKDREEEENKEKLREAAKKELEEWYKNYDEQIMKTRNSNRHAEQEGAAADASPTEEGKEWEKIANLCDFNPKSSKQQKDISRMRSLILQLKQNPPSRRQSSAGNSVAS